MKFYFGLEDTYHVVPKADLTWEASQETSAFLAGKDGMMMDAAYSLIQEAQGTAVAKDVAFAPMPNVPYGMSGQPPAARPPSRSCPATTTTSRSTPRTSRSH